MAELFMNWKMFGWKHTWSKPDITPEFAWAEYEEIHGPQAGQPRFRRVSNPVPPEYKSTALPFDHPIR